jgi:enamine deaminase RidA (YjgF/YER057c/UK114 family)
MTRILYRGTPGWPGQGTSPHFAIKRAQGAWNQVEHSLHPHLRSGVSRQNGSPAPDTIVRKFSSGGVGYSVVDLNDVRHVHAAAVPRRGNTLGEQAQDALRTIDALMHEESTRGSIVHQAVFMADASQIPEMRQIIRGFYGSEMPATSYIPQRPCEGKLIAIEALGVGQGRGDVKIQRKSEQLVTTSHNGIAWVHCAHVVPEAGDNVYDRSQDAFHRMQAMLAGEGVSFDQVIRTWLYIGGIVADDSPTQPYRELNRARSDFYEDISFLADRLPPNQPHGRIFPASTGIGTDGADVSMSCIALRTDRKDILAMPLENPRQTAAFDYAASYSPSSPKFSRAMALSCGQYATIFVSGTASITNSETRHLDNAALQTAETLDNIEALISEENMAQHGLPCLGSNLRNLGFVRVYVKRQEDYAQVRSMCERRLGELPMIYAIADVCRPDLLVEIEGIAFSRRKPG